MTRHKALTVAVALGIALAVITAPVAANGDVSGLTELAVESGGIWNADLPDNHVTAHGNPQWHVYYEDGKFDSLEKWVNSSDQRHLIDHQNETNYATVSAPHGHIGVTLLDRVRGNGLQSRSYISTIDLAVTMENVEPLRSLDSESSFERPGRLTRTLTAGSYSPRGIAFSEDAEQATVGEARTVIGADKVTATGDNITIAVLDTGVNVDDGRVLGNGNPNSEIRILPASKSFITGETVAEDGYSAVRDENGHGTWVASAAAANTSNSTYDGIAPDADILALQTLDKDGQGSTTNIAEAVRYAADHDADVIAMSLGSHVYSESLDRAIQYALDNGVTTVSVAAGNSRPTNRWTASPGDSERVLTVTATNTTDAANATTAYFANVGPDPGTSDLSEGATHGAKPDVGAPGMNVTARVPDASGYISNKTLSGTSMAQPFVAGAVAVALEEHPEWRNETETVNNLVRNSSRPMPNAAVSEVGHGMLALDNLIDQWSPKSQDDSMTETAEAREHFWQSESDLWGGRLGGLYSEVAG
jgi:hypothetical protein